LNNNEFCEKLGRKHWDTDTVFTGILGTPLPPNWGAAYDQLLLMAR
jgi:hypothetical protein